MNFEKNWTFEKFWIFELFKSLEHLKILNIKSEPKSLMSPEEEHSNPSPDHALRGW